MAIICPPSGAPTGEQPNSGWKTSSNRRGTYVGRKGVPHRTGLKAWTKPCFWLENRTLYDVRKWSYFQLAACWRDDCNGQKASYESGAASHPFTSIKNHYATKSPYALYMHCSSIFQLNHLYTLYTLGVKQAILPSAVFQASIYESDFTPPAITAATFNSDGTWSITLSNPSVMFDQYYQMSLYVSTPGQTLLPIHTPIQVSPVTSDWSYSYAYNDNGDGLVAGALKSYPVGSEILMGLRGMSYTAAVMPGPLAAVGVTVT